MSENITLNGVDYKVSSFNEIQRKVYNEILSTQKEADEHHRKAAVFEMAADGFARYLEKLLLEKKEK
jgi:hypothetical protein